MSTTTTSTRKMPYVRLGNSGLKISKIILSTLQYGSSEWQGWVLEQEEAIKHIKSAYDAGIQTFDTANIYSNGRSEIILGNAIKELELPRDEIVVMTKLWGVVGREPSTVFYGSGKNPDDHGYVNQHGLSRKHIFESVKHSLERLQLDYVDILQCHRFDPDTPIEETMQALHDVVQAGYVRYIGMISCYAWQFHAMQNYAIKNKLTPFICMQSYYCPIYREDEREMFPTLKMFGVGSISIPWSPLARNLLTRPLDEQTKQGNEDVGLTMTIGRPGVTGIVNRIEEVAKKRGITMEQVTLAWVLSKEGINAPIVAPLSLKSLEDMIEAIKVKLAEEEVKYLEEPYMPQAIVGHS
ncbi:hypothetical protein D9613_003722 [Agrocybe pediades]|uniref:NADP-dependent oxidoreductase domain-containing protein n=1 Tax=Agrocybe pediades TaxID=84607 RepID=A0A8H4QJ85_9AGAR|nr:hypothetical protein D9613_003722 [Agrocybe pediades]